MPYDYSRIGLDKNLRKTDSVAGRTRPYVSALDFQYQYESTPYTRRTQISKGTQQSTDGGVVEWFDTTGGTKLLSYNPDTGAITINGAVIANVTLTVGTISGGVIGTATIIGGTINSVVIGTPAVTGGTFNNIVAGTPHVTGGTINNPVVGTPAITGGTVNNAVLGTPHVTGGTTNNQVMGTPLVTGGSHNSAVFGTPTVIAGSFTDKLYVGTGANSSIGFGSLATGSVTIATNKVAANSIILVTPTTALANLGILSVGSIIAGTSFTVFSSNILDNDQFNWWLVN